jgi:TRAP-type uncharacterized transport system substrate-binding protein
VDRRRFVQLVTVGAAASAVMGHSPYRQWHVYRKSRLIIVTSADDQASHALGEAIAVVLARHVPEHPALASRAAHALDAVKLLASAQLELAILTAVDARDACDGRGRFAGEGALPLRALAVFAPYLLVCREDFPGSKARLIANALAQHWRGGDAVPARTHDVAPSIPLHTGIVLHPSGSHP